MENDCTTTVTFATRQATVCKGWLRYFAAVVGAGMGMAHAQERVMLDYWWVMPREEAQHAPRVFRVTGEKGEAFEEVDYSDIYGTIKNNPALRQAQLERQQALRREALALARELREAGKSPLVAYEEAWTQVYKRNWLNARLGEGSCALEDMLSRQAAGAGDIELTREEAQWLLEALLEDDDRLDSKDGQDLLRNLAHRLREQGFGQFNTDFSVQDELMLRFAEAMKHGMNSMSAYRDALFKTYRGRIMHFQQVGYHAPVGMGIGGGRAMYRQAAPKVTTTLGSANTQPAQGGAAPGAGTARPEADFTAGMNSSAGAVENFLADAPSQAADKEDDEDKDKKETGEDTDAGIAAAAPSMMMRSFSMRAVAAAAQNEGGAGTSGTPDSPVQGGVIELSPQESMDVGANRITAGGTGGRLENVQMVVTGELHRPVTDDYVTVHNLVSSANGTSPGILTNVTLYAGTSTEYATLHNIAFAGQSALTGYVTFEKTQTTGDIYVAAGGTLTLNNLTFDLRGLAMGDEKTLIDIKKYGGTLKGWAKENVHFVYSGVKVNSAAVDFSPGAGIIKLSAAHAGNLYWNGAADDMWNISSANWSSSGDGTGRETFTALSNVYFGGGNAANKEISVTQDMVVAKLGVTDGGYSFSGARVAVLGDASLTHEAGTVTFNDHLVVQGGLNTAGAGTVALLRGATIVKDAVFKNLTTTIAGDMTVGGKLTVLSGDATTAGTLTITGNVTAKEMELVVNGGSASVSGNLTTTITENKRGSITIGGSAKQQYTGTVTAGDLTVNTQKNDVYFSRLQVDKLTVGEGATVHVQTSSDSVAVSSSKFPVIDLTGTLVLDAPGVTYNDRHSVYVKSDAAKLKFDSGCTVEDLQIFGMADNSGDFNYTDLAIEVKNSSSATVTKMKDLGTLTVNTGSLTVQNAQDAVHGDLILDKGMLKLGAGADDIMADGSGAVELKNGARLDIGSTTQTLSAGNAISLSGASSITGAADGGGLKLRDDSLCVNYENTGNSIDANLTVAAGQTITLNSASANSSLEISGSISGSGDIVLGNSDSETENVPGTVVLYGANTGFKGKVTVYDGSTLTLLNTEALSNASGVVLEFGGTLALNAPGAVNLNALTFKSGSSLSISSIVGTQKASTADAVLNTTTGVTFGQEDEDVVLNLIFSHELDTMQTYNIMTGVSSIDNLSFNIQHNGAALDASQYRIGFDSTTGLLYITTMMGNVWNGEGTGESAKIWSSTGGFDNWSEGKYNEKETLGYTAAVFRDLTQKEEEVTVQGTVTPGDIYFTADATKYTLASDETNGGSLAAGTHIHKHGKAAVTLGLSNNATVNTALGDVDIQSGILILDNAFAVSGTVTVGKDIVTDEETIPTRLEVKGGTGRLSMVNEEGESPYTVSSIATDASATLSGVTMDAAGIRGTGKNASRADKLLVQGTAHLSNLTLSNFETNRYDDDTKGIVTLSDVTLDSTGKLRDVVIGAGVVVDESGVYTLSGNITFDSTLTNQGIITLDKVNSIEIGKLQHTPTFNAESGGVQYVYQLIKLEEKGDVSNHEHDSSQFTINGVKLDGGLHVPVGVVGNGDGALTLIVDNGKVGIPQWHERWGKSENAPAFSRLYVGNTDYIELAKDSQYRYSSIVKDTSNVNNGKGAIVVTLSPESTGNFAVGGLVKDSYVNGGIKQDWYYFHDVEVWIEDRSAIRSVIGGLDNKAGKWTGTYQAAATHVLVDSGYTVDNSDLVVKDWRTWDKSYIIAGSRWCDQYAESYVTVRSGEIYNVFGASCGGHYSGACYEHKSSYEWQYDEPCTINPEKQEIWWNSHLWVTQTGTSHVYVEGGRIGEIFAGGFFSSLNVGEGNRAVEMVLTGGVLGGADLRVFGGADHGVVTGDIYVRMEGSANVLSILVGGSNAGTVNGNIVLDLISGTATKVEAPGKGWASKETATIKGDVWVNLYSDFVLGKGIVDGVYVDGGIYGGKEKTNYVVIDKEGCYSRLHFAEGKEYNLASIAKNGYDTSEDSIIVTGFDRFELEDKAHVMLGLGLFDADMDPEKGASNELVISGKGVVEIIGHGLVYVAPIVGDYGVITGNETKNARNFWRNIQLENSATLKISTSVIGAAGSEDDRTITVTDGTTIDFSGAPAVTGYTGDSYAGLGFNVVIEGYGVDGKGALYKGKYDGPYDLNAEGATSTANRIVLPNVELTNSASVKVEAGETLYMNAYGLGETHLTLNNYTFTKLGAGDFIARSVEMTAGTVLVQQGTFGFDLTDNAAQTDMVLAAGAKLKLNATAPETTDSENSAPETTVTADLTLRSLSGAGTVELNGSTLTLQTVEDSAYYTEYMPVEYTGGSTSYDQFLGTTGFGYAVFSGLIKDDGKLVKDGKGVHYILGSSNTYTGGTELKKGRLYLLGTSTSEGFTKGASPVSSGVAGTGDIEWTGSAAELYLGHGAHIYNKGTVSGEGAVITIGVEGALKGVLANFCKGTTTVTKGEDTYVVIDTHNLKSIAVDALYADGTAYTAGTEIDRSKMLLVKDSSVNATAVTFLSANGYNEAYYSGFLSGNAALRKVGEGTLDLDQTNSYSGEIKIKDTSYTVGTLVEAGTLRLRGWGTVGSGAVQVNAGSSLMLTYIGGYGEDETKSLANDIYLYGNGDEQWKAHDSTSKQTAALISTLGQAVEFTLSGDITGDGGVLHSGDGRLVLNGDSTYTGGTVITRGVVEVQSAKGLGSTANGAGAVVLGENADLHVTVEDGTTGSQLVTTLASVGDDIQGDVNIVGTKSIERILHMADNGYSAATTTLGENGTLLLRGAPIEGKGVIAESDRLTGKGSVVVSDPTGSGATASFGTITNYTGDFRVEGDKASIQVKNGTYGGGSIAVSGQQASVQIGGNVSIEAGESLQLSSTGLVPAQTDKDDMVTGAVLVSHGMVSVAAGAELSASKAGTVYAYDDISQLEKAASVTVEAVVLADYEGEINAYHQLELGAGVLPDYKGRFDAKIAINQQAVAGVNADEGLTLAGGSTYKTDCGHISLMGGSLTLDTLTDNQLTFNTTLDEPYETLRGDVQLVLFSDVSSVKFIYGADITETIKDSGVYYTLADNFLTGCDYIGFQTLLVYDSHAGVVYLQLKVPEPTTSTLGLLALTALCARRRRRG